MSEVGVMLKPPKLRQPIPRGEHDVSTFTERAVPKPYTHVLYVIHPSVIDGDFAHVAQTAIQNHIDNESENSRIILVAPPQGYVYLRPDTKVNDIRTSAYEGRWVDNSDIPDTVEQVTLIGGNLERCLSAFFWEMKYKLKVELDNDESKRKQLTVNLPLDAIYTMEEITAAQQLSNLKSLSDSPLEEVLALLTTPTPYNRQHRHGEFEIVASNGTGTYTIVVNGERLGRLNERETESEPPQDSAEVKWTRIIIPKLPDIEFTLNLTHGKLNPPSLKLNTAAGLINRIDHVRKNVLPKYVVS